MAAFVRATPVTDAPSRSKVIACSIDLPCDTTDSRTTLAGLHEGRAAGDALGSSFDQSLQRREKATLSHEMTLGGSVTAAAAYLHSPLVLPATLSPPASLYGSHSNPSLPNAPSSGRLRGDG